MGKWPFMLGLLIAAGTTRAESGAKPRLFAITLEACAKAKPNHCQFKVDQSILRKYGAGRHSAAVEVLDGSQTLMTSPQFRLDARNDDEGNVKLRVVVAKGVWEVSADERKSLAARKTPLYLMVYPKAKAPAVAARPTTPDGFTRDVAAESAWPQANAAAPVTRQRVAYEEDDREARDVERPARRRDDDERRPGPRAARDGDFGVASRDLRAATTVDREDEGRRVAALSPDETRARPSTYDRFEKWASGQTAQNKPTIALLARMGSPDSPTSHQGGLIEFYPTPIFRLGVGGGAYDSKAHLDRCAGALKYANTTVQSGLTIGNKGGAVKFGLGLTQIQAQYRAGSGVCVNDDRREPLRKDQFIAKSYGKTYTGLTPSLGLAFESDSFYMLNVDYGMFLPMGGDDYKKAPTAPLNPMSGRASKLGTTKSNWLAVGVGVGF